MTRVTDLTGIEIEHLLGDTAGPLVKIRCLSPKTILLGQVTPAHARQIAAHLMEAAARAEYEADLYSTMRATGVWTDQMIAAVFDMVRAGEINRHNEGDDSGS